MYYGTMEIITILTFLSFFTVLCILHLTEAYDNIVYDDYLTLKIIPRNQDQLNFLERLMYEDSDYEFWIQPSTVGNQVHILTRFDKKSKLEYSLTEANMPPSVLIQNIQEKIDKEPRSKYTRRSLASLHFHGYYNLDDIYAWIDDLAATYPAYVSVSSIGITVHRNNIKLVVIKSGKPKDVIVIECGAHPREWLSPSFCMYLINELLSENMERTLKQIMLELEWHIIPVLNPDGYKYSFTKDRLWRKNRNGPGVDVNRNFDYGWPGSHYRQPQDNVYQGTGPFSETESRALRNHLCTIGKNFKFFISIHTYGQYLLVPYGDTRKRSDNYYDTISIAKRMSSAIKEKTGSTYQVGSIAELMGEITGTSMDWVKKTFGVPFVYTIEMRDTGRQGFSMPSDEIESNHIEIMYALEKLVTDSDVRQLNYTLRLLNISSRASSSLLLIFIMILIIGIYIETFVLS